MSDSVPYDPFKLDMFIIGNMLRQEFCNVMVHLSVSSRKLIVLQMFTNTDFLLPLVEWLTAMDPEQRLTAKQALHVWIEIRENIPTVGREWRLRPREEDAWEAATQDAVSLLNVSMHFARVAAERFCRW